MKAKEAVLIIFSAAREGRYPQCFSEGEKYYGTLGAEVSRGRLRVTWYGVYVGGADLPQYHEEQYTEAQLTARLKRHPYFPGLLEPVEAQGHTLGHRFE